MNWSSNGYVQENKIYERWNEIEAVGLIHLWSRGSYDETLSLTIILCSTIESHSWNENCKSVRIRIFCNNFNISLPFPAKMANPSSVFDYFIIRK